MQFMQLIIIIIISNPTLGNDIIGNATSNNKN